MFMKLFFYNAIFFYMPPTSTHLHPPQVDNCDSNSRLVVDGDATGKSRLERVNPSRTNHIHSRVHDLYFTFKYNNLKRKLTLNVLDWQIMF